MIGFIKNITKIMIIVLASLFGLLIILTSYLIIKSPGTPEQFVDNKGNILHASISEKIFIEIGGVKQGMFIRSKNINNPVLLYVHGGPAFPNYFLIDKYKPELEDFFTVCYWEQRGGGLSYSDEVTLSSMNLNQLSEDAIEVTNYLRNRFGKEKIYVLAHSGGTTIALLSVLKQPKLFHSYIAIAQITNQSESEKIAYKYMLDQFEKRGDNNSLNNLKKYHVLESNLNIVNFFKSKERDQYMHELGIGTMHKMNSIFWDIFVPVWTCEAYTLKEKFNIWKSKFSFLPRTNLTNEILGNDFAASIPKIEIPIYFISGKFDLTVNFNLSKQYYKEIQAPFKMFYTFDNSAHSPMFEEPIRFREIIEKDILKVAK